MRWHGNPNVEVWCPMPMSFDINHRLGANLIYPRHQPPNILQLRRVKYKLDMNIHKSTQHIHFLDIHETLAACRFKS